MKRIKDFKIERIKKCKICGCKDTDGVNEMLTEYGFGEHSGYEEFCVKCFNKNTFQNEYGFTFLKFDEKLFCYKPPFYLDFGFRQVCDDYEIERAFNPERYQFEKWLNKE